MTSQPTPLEHDVSDGIADVQKLLTETSPEALVKAFASLTHRMHGATPSTEHVRRMERNLIEEELLRRLRGVRTEPTWPRLTDAQLNRAAQAAYDTKLVHIPAMTDKPRVVSMVRDVLLAVGVPTSALPPEQG